MEFDFTPYFTRYEMLVSVVDGVFDRVKAEYPDCVTCSRGCSDCCHALFDLTLIEALYINHKFNATFGRNEQMLEKANRADRRIYKLKKQAYLDHENGKNEVAVLAEMGMERVRCPLLNDKDLCDLYAFRPITCRIYGIPTSIQGMSHTCGKSGFEAGGKYPTLNMDKIYSQLYALSRDLVADIQTRYVKMDEMLVPVSMALLSEYDDAFFGFNQDAEKVGDGKEEKE